MNIRRSRVAKVVLVLAAIVLTSDRSWAIRQGLGPSKDEWKLKYNVQVSDADSDTLTVVFELEDEGRLKPFYSVALIAFSKPDGLGGQTYDLNEPIKLKPAKDGKRVGEMKLRKDLADRAKIRILTLTLDGQRQQINGGLFYDIPIAKYWKNSSDTAPDSPLAAPRASKVTR